MAVSADIPLPYTPVGEPLIETIPLDGLDFKVVTWNVPEDVTYKGTIVYIHGFCEHSTIYTEFFDKLSQKGYKVLFFDQRGAGETSPGKLVGVTGEKHVFSDLDFMIKKVLDAREDKTEKIILGGHSMGGGIALNYGIHGKYKSDVKAIFVSGPLVTLHPKTEPNILARTVLPWFVPVIPNLKIDSKLNYDFITSHEGWKNYIMSHDTKLIGSLRQFNDMFNRGKKLLRPEHVAKFSPSISVLVMHGSQDNINYIESTKKFIAQLPASVDKEFVEIDGRHSLFIERQEIFDEVFEKLIGFLNAH